MSRYGDASKDAKASACIEAVLATLREHGFSLEHEDGHGSFILAPVAVMTEEERDYHETWLRGARLDTLGDQEAARLALEARKARDAEEKADFERVASALTATTATKSNEGKKADK